jgi:hypothetical protein
MDQEQLKKNLSSSDQWIRIVFMLLFGLITWCVLFVFSVMIPIQALWSLIDSSANPRLMSLSAQLAAYLKELLDYMCYNTDQKPFPFSDFPVAPVVVKEDMEYPIAEEEQKAENVQNPAEEFRP